MAEPVTKKIDTLPAMEEPVATNDKLLFLDVSAPATTMTKLITMNQVRISSAAQLDADVVETAKIKDGAVTSSKLATGAVGESKLGTGAVTESKLGANSVTEAKLGTIKRTVVLRVTSPLDDVEVTNYGGLFPWSVSLNNFIVVDARINLSVAGSTNTTVVLSNQGGTMSTLTLASGATGLSASGAIAASYKTATTNGFLGVNVTAAGTGAKGLTITLVLQGVPQ